jgi:hypothetical protein
VVTRHQKVVTRHQKVVTRYQKVVTRYQKDLLGINILPYVASRCVSNAANTYDCGTE